MGEPGRRCSWYHYEGEVSSVLNVGNLQSAILVVLQHDLLRQHDVADAIDPIRNKAKLVGLAERGDVEGGRLQNAVTLF